MAEDVTSSTPLLRNEYQHTSPPSESVRTTRYDYQSSSSMSTSPVPQPREGDRKPPVTDEERVRDEHSPQGLHEGDFVTYNEQQDLRRGLHQRHISLIAIAGAIVSITIAGYCRSKLMFHQGHGSFPRSRWINSDRWTSWFSARLLYCRPHRLCGSVCTRRSCSLAASHGFFRPSC